MRLSLMAAVLATGCANNVSGPQGSLDFGVPPAGLVAAVPVAIDGRPVETEDARRVFEVREGAHSVAVSPAGYSGDEAGEPPILRATVEVRADGRHRIALRRDAAGSWEVVEWEAPGP